MLARISEEHPGDVRVVYRHFPLLSIHQNAGVAVQAAEAAGLQGKFWEMHDLLFEKQQDWSNLSQEDFNKWLVENAASLEMDASRFEEDLSSPELEAEAQSAWDEGVQMGMPGTPFLLINGQIYNGPMSYGNLSAIVDLIKLQERQYTACPPMIIDPTKDYFATLKTEKGDIVIHLFADKAPLAVNNFVFLAQENWFDNVTFHRVLPGFMAQTGDPTGWGVGGPGYSFKNEISPDLQFDRAGLVAMANSGADTNGSQFFITTGPATHLNGGFTIFGEVVEGMDVVESLTSRDPSQSMTLPPGDKILDVTIEEK